MYGQRQAWGLTGSITVLCLCAAAAADPWPQFRGPNGSGVSTEEAKLPSQIGPGQNVIWQVHIPSGVSSPVVFANRIYLTGEKGDKLLTFALDATDGKVLWHAAAPVRKLESRDKKVKGRRATPSCATDGKHVVSFFGSSGLLCYDAEGKQLWYRPMGPFEDRRGAASSPMIVDGVVLLIEDHETESFLGAFDVKTGEPLWRADRMLFNRSYNTPIIWEQGDERYVMAIGSGLVTAYDFKTGAAKWFVQGTSCVANVTAVLGAGRLYVASSNPGPKREFQLEYPTLVKKLDKNKDGKLAAEELPFGLFAAMFSQFDEDRSGDVSAAEYAAIQKLMGTCRNGMIAVKSGGQGVNRTGSNLLWYERRSTPRTASPIYHDGHLYMTAGSVFVTRNAETGGIVKSARIPAGGKFFSSPVMGDGKIYVADEKGKLMVISAQPQWELISTAEFKETIYPTPAITNGRIYVRTATKLYCFGLVD